MNRRMVVSASVVVALTMASCGGDSSGPTTAAYSDQLAGVCRTINRGIGNLDAATSLDEVRSNATDSSALFEDGLNELKKLTVPSSDKQFAADVDDLIASFEDQLDTLDAIAKSAKEGDQEAVDTKIEQAHRARRPTATILPTASTSAVANSTPSSPLRHRPPSPRAADVAHRHRRPSRRSPPRRSLSTPFRSTRPRSPATRRSSHPPTWSPSATTRSPTHPRRPSADSRPCSIWHRRWPPSPDASAAST